MFVEDAEILKAKIVNRKNSLKNGKSINVPTGRDKGYIDT